MRIRSFVSLTFALAGVAAAAPAFHAELGASYFLLRNSDPQPGSHRLSVDEPEKLAPFVAGAYEFSERFSLRLSYHYLSDVSTVAELGSPPGSPLAVVVWGHYDDDVHLVSAAPEFKWSLAPRLSLGVAPQLNWVASRGVVSFSTHNPAVLLVGPQRRHDDGLTLGGAARLLWSIGKNSVVSLGYQYVDLDPSFGREAHVFSGGLLWRF